jgi:predicted nucleic acid-binding protein
MEGSSSPALPVAVAVRRGRGYQDRWQLFRARRILDALSIEVDPETAANANKTTLGLARSQMLTLYDAAYLEIAMRRNLPLATLDKELRSAAKKVGIKCLPESI